MIIDSLRYNNTLFREINEHSFTTYYMQGMAYTVIKYKSMFAIFSSQQTPTYSSYLHHSHSKVNLILHKSTACKIQPTYREAYCYSDFCFQDHETTLVFSHREKETFTPFPQLSLIKQTSCAFVIKHVNEKIQSTQLPMCSL